MSPRKATVLVLAWNRWDLTKRCLDSLGQTDLSDAEVFVVDNGSTDGTPEALKSYRWLRVLRNPTNLGFVRGNNAGIAAADPESDIVLLNNDLELTQKDWLQRLRQAAHSREDAGIVGCRLRLPDGRLLHAGAYILPDTCWGQQLGSLEKDIGQYPGLREVEGIVFACAYIRREVIRAVGGLSEDYESYFEDTDYSLAARARGFKTFVAGDVTLVHDEHGSTSGDPRSFMQIFQKSRETFRRKWGKAARGALRPRGLLAVHHELPDRLRFELPRDPARARPAGRAGDLPLRLRPGHALPRRRAGVQRRLPARRRSGSAPRRRNRRSRSCTGRGTSSARTGAGARSASRCSRWTGSPRDWVRQASQMDEVWVPTEFNRQGFLAAGLKRPIHKIPLGVDPDYFHPGHRGTSEPDGRVRLSLELRVGGAQGAVASLEGLQRRLPRVGAGAPPLQDHQQGPVGARRGRDPPRCELKDSGGKITFIFNREFPYYQLGSFYRSADCYVSAGRGEGWDMPLIEAMACGLPTIATDWGAHTEFAHEGNGYPLRVRGTIPAVAKCPYYEGFSWADPDPEHLRFLLRHVYENREEARARGAAAAREVAEKWTWAHSAAKVIARLDALQN